MNNYFVSLFAALCVLISGPIFSKNSALSHSPKNIVNLTNDSMKIVELAELRSQHDYYPQFHRHKRKNLSMATIGGDIDKVLRSFFSPIKIKEIELEIMPTRIGFFGGVPCRIELVVTKHGETKFIKITTCPLSIDK